MFQCLNIPRVRDFLIQRGFTALEIVFSIVNVQYYGNRQSSGDWPGNLQAGGANTPPGKSRTGFVAMQQRTEERDRYSSRGRQSRRSSTTPCWGCLQWQASRRSPAFSCRFHPCRFLQGFCLRSAHSLAAQRKPLDHAGPALQEQALQEQVSSRLLMAWRRILPQASAQAELRSLPQPVSLEQAQERAWTCRPSCENACPGRPTLESRGLKRSCRAHW